MISVLDLTQAQIADIRDRLLKANNIHNLSESDRLTYKVQQAIDHIDYRVTIAGENFTAVWLDFCEGTTFGPGTLARVKDQAIKKINASDRGIL